MSAFAVRPDELFALGRELHSSSAQLRDAVDAYDNGFAPSTTSRPASGACNATRTRPAR